MIIFSLNWVFMGFRALFGELEYKPIVLCFCFCFCFFFSFKMVRYKLTNTFFFFFFTKVNFQGYLQLDSVGRINHFRCYQQTLHMQVLITFLNWRQRTKSRNEMGWQSLHTSLLLSSMNIFPNIFQIFPGGLISCIASGLSLLPFCSLPGTSFLDLPAFQGHGNWSPGRTQRMKKTPSLPEGKWAWLWGGLLTLDSPSPCREGPLPLLGISLSLHHLCPFSGPGFVLLTWEALTLPLSFAHVLL